MKLREISAGELTRTYYEINADKYFQSTYKQDLSSLWDTFSSYLGPDAVVLDLGCGSGRDLHHFATVGLTMYGLDFSKNLLQRAQQFSHQPVVLGNFQALPFRNSVLDGVWAMASLLHLPRNDIRSVLSQIRRILKPHSIFFTAVKFGTGESYDHSGRFYAYYSVEEWTNLLSEEYFTVLDVHTSVEVRRRKHRESENVKWINCIATPHIIDTCSDT